MVLLPLLAALSALGVAVVPSENHINVLFEFEDGLEGWANSTSEEMGGEFYSRGGELEGEFRVPNPHFDSPLMISPVTDRNYVVIRMKYAGTAAAASGSFYFRSGDVLPPSRYARGEAVWDLKDPSQWEVPFEVIPDGQYHVYYVPLFPFKLTSPELQLNLTQMRLNPVFNASNGQALKVDWIRVVKAPTILQVLGCANLPPSFGGVEWVTPVVVWQRRSGPLNQFFNASELAVLRRGVGTEAEQHFGMTYNCLREGGDRITLIGHNFGLDGARVTVNGRPCHSVTHDVPETAISCTAPSGVGESVNVTIANGVMPLLRDTKPFFSYTVGPAPPPVLNFSNIGAQHLDINWRVAYDLWDALTTTGYWIERRAARSGPVAYVNRTYNASEWDWEEWNTPVVTSNVTTTTMIGLQSDTRYQFRVAALSENLAFSSQWLTHDLYGRRSPVPGYIRGNWSVSGVVATLLYDFEFTRFDANSTLNFGPMDKRAANGMIGETIGEGHFGLVLIGDANVENCNASTSCCDNYGVDPLNPLASCTLSCSTVARLRPPYINNIAQRARMFYPIPTKDPDPLKLGIAGNPSWVQPALLPAVWETLFPNGILIGDPAALVRPPRLPCGPALRLTPSQARKTGAMWYNRKQQVREGFDTTFVYRISNPSVRCTVMDDVYTKCRSRGGDGFAFVVHNDNAVSMGQPASGMGFVGIRNGIAIEFDTFYNPEQMDPWENHVAVVTRGWRDPLSSNHSYELGHATAAIPDLTDGIHTVRIMYSPQFNTDSLYSPAFVNDAPGVVSFLTNRDYPSGGYGDWGGGFGELRVYFNNQTAPSLIVALNLEETVQLDNGRAYVGFTASTGDNIWQVHDLLSWHFTQKREDWVAIRNANPRTA